VVQPELIALGTIGAPAWLTPEAIASVQAAEDRPFTEAEYDGRMAAVRRVMTDRAVDAMFVFRPSSIEYLCGYHTAERTPQPLLVTQSDTLLYVPDLELGRALASARADTVVYCGYADALRSLELMLDHAVRLLPSRARVAIEFGHTSTPPQAVELLQRRPLQLVHGDHLVERQRLTLSAAEIACVEQAAVCTQAGVEAAIAAAGRPEATDSSVAAAISAALVAGANAPSAWGPVVATGHRAGIAHSSWVHRPLSGPTTFLELAGAHHRYHAPVMRTLSHGTADPPARRLVDLARTTVAAVLDNARAGVPASRVAQRAAKALGPLPDDVVFHQVFGYPVGLAHPPHWMDGAPFYITVDNHEPLEAGMVFHTPASFRSFGQAGVGLSQTFVVEDNGARVLTHGRPDVIEL
jgi:Xaa-Pro dipeptidase